MAQSHYDEFDPYENAEQLECDHWEYEIDFNGRARCDCGKSWWATQEQIDAQARLIAAYDRMQRRENSWWMRTWRWCENWIFIWPFGHAEGPFNDLPF